MLTSIGRAAARRVAASANATRNLNSNAVLTSRPAFVLRPVSLRSFSVSQWSGLAAKAKAEGTATPATTKTKTKTRKGKGRPKSTNTTPKKKKKAKKTAAPKKKAPKPKKEKKPLDPVEQKKLDIKEWKKQGLTNDEPHLLPTNAYTLFVQNRFNDHYQECKSLGETSKHLRAEYQNYSTAEKQRLEAQAQANKLTNYSTLKAWVQSYPIEVIYLANIARRKLRTALKKSGRGYLKLEDDRMPKRPPPPFIRFVKSRFPSVGNGQPVPTVMKEIAKEWHTLRDAETQPLVDQYAKEMETYRAEFDAIRSRAVEKTRELKKEAKVDAKAEAAEAKAKRKVYRANSKARKANAASADKADAPGAAA